MHTRADDLTDDLNEAVNFAKKSLEDPPLQSTVFALPIFTHFQSTATVNERQA